MYQCPELSLDFSRSRGDPVGPEEASNLGWHLQIKSLLTFRLMPSFHHPLILSPPASCGSSSTETSTCQCFSDSCVTRKNTPRAVCHLVVEAINYCSNVALWDPYRNFTPDICWCRAYCRCQCSRDYLKDHAIGSLSDSCLELGATQPWQRQSRGEYPRIDYLREGPQFINSANWCCVCSFTSGLSWLCHSLASFSPCPF